MKKLKLNQSRFVGAEVLSRAELKKVMGGIGSTELKCDMCDAEGGTIWLCGHFVGQDWLQYYSCIQEDFCGDVTCTGS